MDQRLVQVEEGAAEANRLLVSGSGEMSTGLNNIGLQSPNINDPSLLQAAALAGKALMDRQAEMVLSTPDGQVFREDPTGHVIVVGNTMGRPRGLADQWGNGQF